MLYLNISFADNYQLLIINYQLNSFFAASSASMTLSQ